MKTHLMGEMTVAEIRNYLKTNKTVVLPYGVVEQHGYHLPVDTDIRNCVNIGGMIAKELGCIMAPPLNYCFSGGMLPGTINIKPTTFANMMCEIVESLVVQGFENILIVPGHGGSESKVILRESLRIMKWLNPVMQDALVIVVGGFRFAKQFQKCWDKGDHHAGLVETSLILHWSPEMVRSKIVLDTPSMANLMRKDPDAYQVQVRLTDLEQEIPTTYQNSKVKVGVMGFPHEASAEFGKKLFEEIRKRAIPVLKKAIAMAERRRKVHKNGLGS